MKHMEYLILFIIIISQTVAETFAKFYNVKTQNRSAYVFCGCSMLVAALFFLATSNGLNFTTEFLGYSAGFGFFTHRHLFLQHLRFAMVRWHLQI